VTTPDWAYQQYPAGRHYPPADDGPRVAGGVNVLLITLDQLRADALSCAGNPVIDTPTLDSIAAQGTRFLRHYANSTPCSPSRSTLHTGMYQFRHRVVANGTPLDDRFTNLALEARGLGYTPYLFGYTDTTWDPRGRPLRDPGLYRYESVMRGWDSMWSSTAYDPRWVTYLARMGYEIPADYWELYAPVEEPGAAEHGASWAPTRFPPEHTETHFLTDEFLDFLRVSHTSSFAGPKPWFVHLSYLRPHPPYRAPRGYHDLYSADSVPAPIGSATREAEAASHPFLTVAVNNPLTGSPETDLDTRQLKATYYGLIREADDNLARVVEALKSSGQWDRTVVIVLSDHGEQAGDHHLIQKLGWFDSSYHVPLIIRDPRAEADPMRGKTIDAFTEQVDIMPTVLDYLGGERWPLQVDGRTLRPWVRGETPEQWRDAVFWEFDFRELLFPIPELTQEMHQALRGLLGSVRTDQCALNVIRTSEAKYVRFPSMPTVLYDLDVDPQENENLADDPSRAGVARELAERIIDRRMQHDERVLANTLATEDQMYVMDDRLT